ncbi:sulfurtransferase TusA family protein [Bacillus aquiflavi]|uniref:Sulfurtransferase TusA family protein n=1 Tax=Bacillus aquiflavi TaxID=2672567 RepID=A0A6B3VUQ6_9BACI|nr:sulfurtransferase TusA family protein [Bacillus aquiflavi]MBA4537733.1 sulfurtransferase TusA family protein [Bacillus aquiflavi]NEY81990.1 sulfurtransferase TusA family protein [Bacillus aquiflavi]UAC49883.1 sulfurtransferase TusA family protein [Bacillus aquiflavi]
MEATKVLDAKGLSCPMPIVRIKQSIGDLNSGEILEVHTTDKGSQKDVSAWVQSTGHELLQTEEDAGVFKFWIKKA